MDEEAQALSAARKKPRAKGGEHKKSDDVSVQPRFASEDRIAAVQITCLRQLEIARDVWSIAAELSGDMDFWLSGHPVVYLGIFFALLCEVFNDAPKYNFCIILIIYASIGAFSNMIPQFMTVVVFVGSFILDCVYWANNSTSIIAKGLTGLVFFSKTCAIYLYIQNEECATMKKLLYRRLLVFGVTSSHPQRINRDMLSRILAICWIHLFGIIIYAVAFLLSVSLLSNVDIVVNPTQGIPFWQFLLVKTLSSAIILLLLLRDADIVLSLTHFGLYGCYMESVRRYIAKKMKGNRPFPLMYVFRDSHFNVFIGAKVLDFGWGIVGWVTLSSLLGSSFLSARTDVKGFVSVLGFTLAVTDVWCLVLVLFVKQRINSRNLDVNLGGLAYDSDDSEMYEMNMKTSREGAVRDVVPPRRVRVVEDLDDIDEEEEDDDEEEEEEEEEEEDEEPVRKQQNFKQAFDEDVERASVGASREQFTSSRQFSELGRVTSFGGDGATPLARRESADRVVTPRIVIEGGTTIPASEFSAEWNRITEIQELTCGFSLPASINADKLRTSDMKPFINYLKSIGLSIAAAGDIVNKSCKVYAYVIGRKEIDITITSKSRAPYCSLECTIKCSNTSYTADFLLELQLESKLNGFNF